MKPREGKSVVLLAAALACAAVCEPVGRLHAQERPSSEPAQARLHFRLVSPNGGIDLKGQVRIVSVRTGVVFESVRTSGAGEDHASYLIESVPFGNYRVDVRVTLFGQEDRDREITVGAKGQWHTVALRMQRPMIRVEKPAAVFRGRILGSEQSGPLWVKVVGLYANTIAEFATNPDGTFECQFLLEGRYVAIIYTPDAEPALVAFSSVPGVPVELTLPNR